MSLRTVYLFLLESHRPSILFFQVLWRSSRIFRESSAVRNPDSPWRSSFHYRCSNTRKRNRTGLARQMKELASVCSYFPTALRFPPATPICFPTLLFLPRSPPACSSALGCFCHFPTAHYSDVPSRLILLYVLAKWRHNSPWQSLEHPEHWLTPESLFNLDGSLY